MKSNAKVKFMRAAMKAADMDKRALADATGIDPSLIHKYLEDDEEKRVDVGAENARRIAVALNVSVLSVLYGPGAA